METFCTSGRFLGSWYYRHNFPPDDLEVFFQSQKKPSLNVFKRLNAHHKLYFEKSFNETCFRCGLYLEINLRYLDAELTTRKMLLRQERI